MKMPGFWVSKTDEGVSLTQTVFDETVSTPPLSRGRPIRTRTLMRPFAGTSPLRPPWLARGNCCPRRAPRLM
jgi:hypothetical protein